MGFIGPWLSWQTQTPEPHLGGMHTRVACTLNFPHNQDPGGLIQSQYAQVEDLLGSSVGNTPIESISHPLRYNALRYKLSKLTNL